MSSPRVKIWVLSGLQGSGKSTLAKKICKDYRNTYRVNKDLLRQNLYFADFNILKERAIAEANNALVESLLANGHNVVSDNMNLSERDINFYKSLAEKYNAELEVVKMDVPVYECIRRDALRKERGERFVGKDIILNAAFRYNILRSPNQCVVSDMDGTLADISHRHHFIDKTNGKKPDWDAFFEQCFFDKPRREVIDKVMHLKNSGLDLIIVSARPEKCRKDTEDWLKHHGIIWDRLIFRQNEDTKDDRIVKQEILDKLLDKSKIVKIFDDRPKVIRMWRENGLTVEDVGDGVEF